MRPKWTASGLQALAVQFTHDIAMAPVSRIVVQLRALLRAFGVQAGLDRTTVFRLARDRRGFQPVASWHEEGVRTAATEEIRPQSSDLARRVIGGEIIHIERLDPIPPNLSAYDLQLLRGLGHKSLLVLPLRVGGGTVGAHTLGGLRRAFCWPRRFIEDLAVIQDVMALALERLRSHEEREQEQLEDGLTQRIAGIGHWRHNLAMKGTVVSAELCRALQLDLRRELGLVQIIERIEAEDRERFRAQVEALELGRESPAIECRVRRQDGEIRWFRCWGQAVAAEDAGPRMIHGVVHDITERKRVEQQLEAAQIRLVHAQEQERARLGRELHDELGQRLAALDLRLVSMSRALGSVPGSFDEAIEQVQELGFLARAVSHSLYPAQLQRLGLVSSLELMCQRTSLRDAVDVEFEGQALPHALPPATALALYRVGQEAVGNALRHANACRIVVSVEGDDEHVRLSVVDDGDGFDCSIDPEGESAQGLGLSSMRERMRLVDGSLVIESPPGGGTSIRAEAPVQEHR